VMTLAPQELFESSRDKRKRISTFFVILLKAR